MDTMKYLLLIFIILFSSCQHTKQEPIDRSALVHRNHPHITGYDPLSSLSVGNGEFAYTVDVTGLQTFPEKYRNGVPLGTQAQWGWHSFPNTQGYRFEESIEEYDLGRGRKEPYAVNKFIGNPRRNAAAKWFRQNPHRLHLGIIGLELENNTDISRIEDIDQHLDLWQGVINSSFRIGHDSYKVQTLCHPELDMVAFHIVSQRPTDIKFHFPYGSGAFIGDACDWNSNDRHNTTVLEKKNNSALLKRELDTTVYYLDIRWEGEADLIEKSRNYFLLQPRDSLLSFTCRFMPDTAFRQKTNFNEVRRASAAFWKDYWTKGGAVDFSHCTDPRARELERRVILSRYLTAIQCSGTTPPQETGLTYNSWFGSFHLEMIWWHQTHFALWGHPERLARTLEWYRRPSPLAFAKEIASRQGFNGIRWMKQTGPSGKESPSDCGSFLIWQQPHLIYMAELLYRLNPSKAFLEKFNPLIQETAAFMYSFASYEKDKDRYVLKGLIPAQETDHSKKTVNPAFELSYWHFGMQLAQMWRERAGMERRPEWDELVKKLSPLPHNEQQIYQLAESNPDIYEKASRTSHPMVLGAVGMLPMNPLINRQIMKNTLAWTLENWDWATAWGWDYPMIAMNATRLGEPQKAVDALLMDTKKNTFLTNGHNYQSNVLRIYLPGNGGLLTAIAMMCAGWDGCTENTPGFPKDGSWDVRWEGLEPLP